MSRTLPLPLNMTADKTEIMEPESLTLKVFYTLNKRLETAWREMEKQENVSPFLYFDYLKYVFRQVSLWNVGYVPVVYCVEDKTGNVLMIAPMKRNIGNGTLKMLGDTQGCGKTGFMFSGTLDDSGRDVCVGFFMNEVKRTLKLNRIEECSQLMSHVAGKGSADGADKQVCVRLVFKDDTEEYLKWLSASVRQNLRTAYNRMKRDGINYELKVYSSGLSVDNDTWNEVMDLYLKRLLGKYKKKKGALYRAYKDFYYRNIKHDTKSLRYSPNAFHALLYADGKLMSFMSGYIDQGQTEIAVPRLAMSDDFRFYSPGYVLVCETMRWLAENTQVRCMDLSRGDEKYKLDFGGEKYFTNSFIVKQN